MDTTRVSDAERERTADRLRSAVGEGRLDLVEFDERLRRAYAAVTRADLAMVTADLPAGPAPGRSGTTAGSAPPVRADAGETAEAWRSWLGGSLVMVAIWGGISLAAGTPTSFWPAVPIAIWAAVLLVPLLTGRPLSTGCGGHRL